MPPNGHLASSSVSPTMSGIPRANGVPIPDAVPPEFSGLPATIAPRLTPRELKAARKAAAKQVQARQQAGAKADKAATLAEEKQAKRDKRKNNGPAEDEFDSFQPGHDGIARARQEVGGMQNPNDPGWAYRNRPVARAFGWAVRNGGRSANVEAGTLYQGTTSHVCGLFPFAVSSGATVRGVPIGRNMLTAEPIGLDPSEWLRDGLISNTGVWVQGQPGIGKSTIVKRMFTGMVGFGFVGIVPGDVKGEYSALIEALGGRVWRIGRGMHSLNPLDPGPMRAALAQAQGSEKERLEETIRARQLSLLEALLVIVRNSEVTVTERRILGLALDLVTSASEREPVIPDVLRVLMTPPEEILSIAACTTAEEFRRDSRNLINTLGLCCEGAIRGIFDRPSSITADLDTRAISLDISALDDDDDDVVAAAMLSSWTWSASLIDGATAATGERRNVIRIQDELWRALRVAPGLVERSDKASRLDRTRGEVTVRVTHSFDDLKALPTVQDQMKAKGLASRSAILILGGMADSELDDVRHVTPMSDGEVSLIRSWSAPPTWVPGTQHPGRGKYMIKSGDRMGLPVSLTLVPSERELYNTEQAFHRAAKQ